MSYLLYSTIDTQYIHTYIYNIHTHICYRCLDFLDGFPSSDMLQGAEASKSPCLTRRGIEKKDHSRGWGGEL